MPLLVATKVRQSSIEGFGLFADEDINYKTIVWQHNAAQDGWFNHKDWNTFPESLKTHILHFCCYDEKLEAYIRAGDNANWMNHSYEPNLFSPNYYMHIASRDITKGEELTVDYRFIEYNNGTLNFNKE